jgi:excisionase family DNA binding protein
MDELAHHSEAAHKPGNPGLSEFVRELANRKPTKAELCKALTQIAQLERDAAKTVCAHTPAPEVNKTKAAAYTVAQAAALLNMSVNGVYMAVRRKQIPAIRIGTKILIPKTILDRLLEIA